MRDFKQRNVEVSRTPKAPTDRKTDGLHTYGALLAPQSFTFVSHSLIHTPRSFNSREVLKSDFLPLRDLRCCTAILSTVSLSSFRDIGLQVGIMADSLSMRLFILSRLLFSIWLCGSLKVHKASLTPHYCHGEINYIILKMLLPPDANAFASLN